MLSLACSYFLLVFIHIKTVGSVLIDRCIAINYYSELYKGLDIIQRYPHDSKAFTQGLNLVNNTLYESTGLYGKSSIRKVDKKSGDVITKTKLDQKMFGEGIAIFGDEMYQLTWKNRVVNVFNKYDLKYKRSLQIPKVIQEGWGMTRINNTFAISDGSDCIYLVEPTTFTLQHIVRVRRGNNKLIRINELQTVNGLIFANIWYEDVLCVIDLVSGKVISEFWCDISRNKGEDVFNGIAYDESKNRLLLTGKLWDSLFEAVLVI
ncbi:hypothetical protein EIN_223910 [Entamoeba invadens IP1]|uniref:Glutamine cyclotransferase n=1 Tax=Entamoeba invadens IP1 TaxID=370355 RepID=A0A0A1U863_ENTIV|nr:hypothetical protein EIN_223910 [Entamoeba invadens IP1]ELP88168.1 hypothetical protein EIN_223910 [Entamoeba invadens IP1]|eukprot:XP_004254939.1 hypothetical protein EIN_223910 [Entamoeba invadens IP1]